MTGKKPGTKWISFIIIITALFLASCNLLRPPAPEESEGEKRKNPPKALTQMEKVTDDIIQDLEEVREKRAKQLREEKSPSRENQPEDQQEQAQQQKEGQQMGQGQENQQDNQGGEQQSQEQQNTQPGQQQGQQTQQPQQTPQPIPEPDWSKLESMAETLNEQWNSFEPAAKSDGAMSETMKRFEEQLISLTEQIMARNEEKTLVAANSLYSYYPDFLKLYFHNQPPEIKELRGLPGRLFYMASRISGERSSR